MEFLEKYHIHIKNEKLLMTALTHSSYSNEHRVANYERLEFLGDSVLQLVMSQYFYENTTLNEGMMSKIRASYVCEAALAGYAESVGYIPYIRVGHGQLKNINQTIIADIFESITGAIYLDQGFEVAKKYLLDVITPFIKEEHPFFDDYKSLLQELVQTNKKSLNYVVTKELGPAHNKTFEVEVRIDNMVYGTGRGKSKKEAEQQAAFDAYKKQGKR